MLFTTKKAAKSSFDLIFFLGLVQIFKGDVVFLHRVFLGFGVVVVWKFSRFNKMNGFVQSFEKLFKVFFVKEEFVFLEV